MQPKSMPVLISTCAAIVLGVALIGVGVGVPYWINAAYPLRPASNSGLFETCVDGDGCRDRHDKPGEVELVAGLCIGACATGFMAFLSAVLQLCMFRRKKNNSCMELLPWTVLLWSLITGGGVVAALVIFEEKEFDSSDEYIHLGMSFVFTAAGAGFVVLAGLIYSVWSHRLLVYLRRMEMKKLKESRVRGKALQCHRPRIY